MITDQIMAGAEPFVLDGETAGVLVLHGFTGTPQSIREYGHLLHTMTGWTVHAPLLAGHGRTPEAMAETGWRDWLNSADDALKVLAGRGHPVFVTGLSMGGTLALYLASDPANIIAGCIPINAPGYMLALGLEGLLDDPTRPEYFAGVGSDIAKPGVTELAYERYAARAGDQIRDLVAQTRARLGAIRAPVLICQSEIDHVVPPENAALMAEAITAPTQILRLTRSYHVATLDHDLPLIAERALAFMQVQLARRSP